MRRVAMLCLAGSLLMLGGCAAWSPEAKLLAARESFNGTVHGLATFRESGAFTKEQAEHIGYIIHLGEAALNQWEAALRLNQSPSGFAERMRYIVRELVAAQIAAERREENPQ